LKAASGTWQADYHGQQQNLSASVAINALTITLNSMVLPFRDTTASTGYVLVSLPQQATRKWGRLTLASPRRASLSQPSRTKAT